MQIDVLAIYLFILFIELVQLMKSDRIPSYFTLL